MCDPQQIILNNLNRRNLIIEGFNLKSDYNMPNFYQCTLSVKGKTFLEKNNFVIFKKTVFSTMNILMSNIAVKFIHCIFTIVNIKTLDSSKLMFLNLIFQNTTWKLHKNSGHCVSCFSNIISLSKINALQLRITNSNVTNVYLSVMAKYFSINIAFVKFWHISNTSHAFGFKLQREYVHFIPANKVSLYKVVVFGSAKSKLHKKSSSPFINIHIENIILLIQRCQFFACAQIVGISSQLVRKSDGIFLQIVIQQSLFHSISTSQNGGSFLISLHKHITPLVLAEIKFINNVFMNVRSFGEGGAIYITAEPYLSVYNRSVSLEIINSQFINCLAMGNGGSIFIGSLIRVNIRRVLFLQNENLIYSKQGLFIFSKGKLALANIILIFYNSRISTDVVHLTHAAMVKTVVLQCPNWNYVSISYQGSASATIFCKRCLGTHYSPFLQSFHISYSNISKSLNTYYLEDQQANIRCLECPYGAVCSNGNLKSMPGFWGTRIATGEYEFYQCLGSYCCMKTACEMTAPCSGHRTGTLCGICQGGYSLSMLSDQCMENTDCHDAWMWPAAVFLCFCYVIWYSFMSDMLPALVSLMKKVHFYIIHKVPKFHLSEGCFGILVYFVQISSFIHLEDAYVDRHSNSDSIKQVTFYLTLMINIDPSGVSMSVCPQPGLTMENKMLLKFIFMLGTYCSCVVIYLMFCGLHKISFLKVRCKCTNDILNKLKKDLLSGLFNIIMYTYEGFTSIVFASLLCVQIGDDKIWKFNGEIMCYSKQQWVFIVISIIYVFPFPISFAVAKKYLKENRISVFVSILACMLPLPFLVMYFLWIQLSKIKFNKYSASPCCKNQTNDINTNRISSKLVSGNRSVVLNCLEGPYRTEGQSAYWESIMLVKRLILTLFIFVDELILKYLFITSFCILFFIHHNLVRPYKAKRANLIETLSLMLIIITANVNSLKACFVANGIIPSGSFLSVLSSLDIVENCFIYFLLLVIGTCSCTCNTLKTPKIAVKSAN